MQYAPPFIGDYINQEMATAATGQWIPEGQRVFLPTEVIAKAWSLEKVPDPSSLPPAMLQPKPGSVVIKQVVETKSKSTPAPVAVAADALADLHLAEGLAKNWLTRLSAAKTSGLSVRDWPAPPPKGEIPEEANESVMEYGQTVRRMRDADAKLLSVFAQTMRATGDKEWPLPGEPLKPPASEKPATDKDPNNTRFGRKVTE